MLFPHHFRVGFRFVRLLPLQVLDHVSCRFDQLSQSRQLVVAVIADLFDPAADFYLRASVPASLSDLVAAISLSFSLRMSWLLSLTSRRRFLALSNVF